MDRLSYILDQLNVNAGVFFQGQLCGLASFEEEGAGYIHVLRSGVLDIIESNKEQTTLNEPTMIFSVRSEPHQLFGANREGAEMVCASIKFQTGAKNPVLEALPSRVVLPLSSVQGLTAFVDVLFSEAEAAQEGREAIMNRLVEVIFVNVLRHIVSEGETPKGMLSALADKPLSKVLKCIDTNLNGDLSVEKLAEVATMSRSTFIQHFKNVLGLAPGEYVQNARISAAKRLILKDKPMSIICFDVGYEDASGFSRAFKKNTGMTPREWKKLNASVTESENTTVKNDSNVA
ncbi:AraC family transcriptional regulator [Marinobacter sp. F3R08]|uniref:AraC family transcriptional regulator n=1 Tax=Marinobacter sp. F3R08 TaxID=2841559 RepID=UPI001C0A29E6|nr:AraC family transcriptional regulator [Marinobacter sp. F3R08]MBU2955944.1 AraC family transcriptional regulator [Marinobacter sp. F3R08]